MSVKLLVALIPLLPLIGFLLIGLFGKHLSKIIISLIACGTILGSFIIVLTFLIPAINGGLASTTIKYFDWITVGNLNIPFSFLIDPLSVLMMSIITGVGFLIHVYSAGYMSHDDGFHRYFSYLNLFVFAMLLLVMGANYLVLFTGWEGVGLCSYLLIGFWFKNNDYNNAAKKAFIMNRIGDLGFLLGMLLIVTTYGSLDYSIDLAKPLVESDRSNNLFLAITLLLFIGATGKSAQIPLYTWLPDAMAGPTPVSALIHAATMVTAGVYMIVRSNVLFAMSPLTLEIIEVIGLTTALFAGTIALVQNDIKKVLAYSTVSQLGFMFFALGMGAYSTAMFHVTTHAFFKALLFLCAGSVIHAMSGEQDIRNMGGLRKKLPITFFTFLIGAVAISGIPPFAGFFSKDEILTRAFEHSPFLWGIALVAALMTTFYMFRLLFLTFFGDFRGTHEQEHHLHESPLSMTIPLMVLAVLSAIGGFIGVPEVLGGNNFLHKFLGSVVMQKISIDEKVLSHGTELMLMGISTGAVVVMILITYLKYKKKESVPSKIESSYSSGHNLLYKKYYVDEIYNALFVRPTQWFSDKFYSILEVKVIDDFVNSVGMGVTILSKNFRLIQTGNITFYLLAMVVGIVAILFFNSFLR